MVIIARSDARAIEGWQAAIDRVNAYLEAPKSAEELAAAARQLIKPALVNRIGIYPSQTHRAAIAAAKKVLAVLKRDGDTAAIERELETNT